MALPDNSVSVGAGLRIVTGNATNFIAAENDLFIAGGAVVPIASRDSPTQLTLKQPWPVASLLGSTDFDLLSLGQYWRSAIPMNKRIAELVEKWEVVSPFKFDAAGSLAERNGYNGQTKGFIFVAIDQVPVQIFMKLTNTNTPADWSRPIYLGDGGQVEFVSALEVAKAALELQIAGRASLGHTSVANVDYQAVTTDVQIGLASLTAPRTIRLPDVDVYPMGQVLFVADESGACSEAIPIIIGVAPGSGDTIAGASSHKLTSAYQGQGFRRGASNLWIFA